MEWFVTIEFSFNQSSFPLNYKIFFLFCRRVFVKPWQHPSVTGRLESVSLLPGPSYFIIIQFGSQLAGCSSQQLRASQLKQGGIPRSSWFDSSAKTMFTDKLWPRLKDRKKSLIRSWLEQIYLHFYWSLIDYEFNWLTESNLVICSN